MKIIAKLLALILLSFSSLSALNLMDESAFNPRVKSDFHTSLLNIKQSSREDSISIYGKGLQYPFSSFTRFGSAFVDAFRLGKARQSMLAYQSPNGFLNAEFNFIAGVEPVQNDETYSFIYKGFQLETELRKRWQLNTGWWNGIFFGDQTNVPTNELVDGYSSDHSGKLNLDNLNGDLSYNAKNLVLALGRGKFQLGNSISGSIIANDAVNDYAYLLAEGKLGAFSLSFMHATLQSDSTYNIYNDASLNSKNYPEKYLALHQLGFHPRSNLNLFLGETVVYGNRSIDLNYLLPNAFWRATEHNLWDRDNVMIFAGGNYRPLQLLFLYAQVALDEFSYSKITTSWWGNKYAVQGGMRYTLQWALPKSAQPDVTAELTAVRPFTYTHYMKHTMYAHDGRSLGYPKGSNLVDVSALLRVPYRDILMWQSGLSIGKQGSFGADFAQNYHDAFPGDLLHTGTATWFQGQKTNYTELKSSLLIDLLAHHRLLAGFKAKHISAWDSEVFGAWQFVF